MDVINEVVGSARAGQAFARRIGASGPWGLRFPAFPGAGFHVILRGSGCLVTAAGEPVTLRQGDIVFAPHGTEHGLSHAARALGELPAAAAGTQPADPGPAAIEFLCGACRTSSTSRLTTTATPNSGHLSTCSTTTSPDRGPAPA